MIRRECWKCIAARTSHCFAFRRTRDTHAYYTMLAKQDKKSRSHSTRWRNTLKTFSAIIQSQLLSAQWRWTLRVDSPVPGLLNACLGACVRTYERRNVSPVFYSSLKYRVFLVTSTSCLLSREDCCLYEQRTEYKLKDATGSWKRIACEDAGDVVCFWVSIK